MEVPATPEPVSSKTTPIGFMFRDVPSPVAEDLRDVLLNNPDARKALLLFLQDSGLLPANEEFTWENPQIEVTIPDDKIETSSDDDSSVSNPVVTLKGLEKITDFQKIKSQESKIASIEL